MYSFLFVEEYRPLDYNLRPLPVIKLITATNNADPMIDQMIGKFSPPMLKKKSFGK
jgi:hypothetical protein